MHLSKNGGNYRKKQDFSGSEFKKVYDEYVKKFKEVREDWDQYARIDPNFQKKIDASTNKEEFYRKLSITKELEDEFKTRLMEAADKDKANKKIL